MPVDRSSVSGSAGMLIDVLTGARQLRDLDLRQWDVLVRAARAAGMFSQIAMRAYARGLDELLPAPVRPHLEAARVIAERQRVVVAWEINRIERALRHVDAPVVLLKGAAYQAIGLPTAAGRPTVDIDLLVPRTQLPAVEAALVAAGWAAADIDPRDQAYFRQWLHELPPLRHTRRRTLLDVHHTILPPTDRLVVDPALLIEAAVPVPGLRALVLAPADMFLHSAAHLFRNGAWAHGVRDLMDMDAMLRRFGADAGFWSALLERADRLNLAIPCAAALRALGRYIGTPIPEAIRPALARWQPHRPVVALHDRLIDRALLPRGVDRRDPGCDRARRVLAYWPPPRWAAVRTVLFWTKRLPLGRKAPQAESRVTTAQPAGAPRRPDEEDGRDA